VVTRIDIAQVAASEAPLDRRAAARDLWPGGTLRMWHGEEAPQPDRVWWPESDAELEAVLRAASERGTPVVPYGAGSGVCGGARGRAGSWVVDLKRLDTIGAVDPERWVVEVGAGVNGQHLEDALAAQGFTLGHSPSSIGCSTVGGWIAARSAGQFSSRYGVLDDMVLGVDAVAPGVGAFCVGWRGASSPPAQEEDALLGVLAGSEGTLAVITRARLRVRPLPEHRWLRGYQFEDVGTALDAMRRLMQGELWPAAVRLYDPVDTWIGGRTRPRSGGHGGGATRAWWRSWVEAAGRLEGARKRALVLPLSVPGLLQRVAEGLASGCLLIVGWEGRREVAEAGADAGHRMLAELGRDLGPEPGERWYASRHAVSYKLMPVFEHGGFADTMEIAGPWSVLPRAYAAVREAVAGTALAMAHMSHVYPEGGCIYFSFAGRGDSAVYDRLWARALAAVREAGATATHHHGVGELKAEAATQEVGPAIGGWLEARARLDPAGIMNPGRLFRPGAPATPPPAPTLGPLDGLRRRSAAEDGGGPRAEAEGEAMWGWERPEGPSVGAREPWQSTWLEVRGRVGAEEAAIGRGPRSACGPDLRPWLAARGEGVSWTVAWSQPGDRWLGAARVPRPWAVARAILRADLRPAVLEVEDGALRVGFRGPAARVYGALASALVPGGLAEEGWRAPRRAAGALEPCEEDDPGVLAVTCETAWRRADAGRTPGGDAAAHAELAGGGGHE
jgi:alkyldihydroxyacetonephosphate synthase